MIMNELYSKHLWEVAKVLFCSVLCILEDQTQGLHTDLHLQSLLIFILRLDIC